MDMGTDNREVSEFNGSQLKLFRIDEILRGITMSRHTLNIKAWLFFLQDFDMELESVKKKEEIDLLDKDLKILAEEVNQYIVMSSNTRIRHKSTPTELIDHLNAFQKKLLRIFKESGLEMKLQEGALGRFGK